MNLVACTYEYAFLLLHIFWIPEFGGPFGTLHGWGDCVAEHAIAFCLAQNLQPRLSTTIDSAPTDHLKFIALHLEFVAIMLHCSVRARCTAMQL